MAIYYEKKGSNGWILAVFFIAVILYGGWKLNSLYWQPSSHARTAPVSFHSIDPAGITPVETRITLAKPTDGPSDGIRSSHLTATATMPALAGGPASEALILNFSQSVDLVGVLIQPECPPSLPVQVALGVGHHPFIQPDPLKNVPVLTNCTSPMTTPVWFPQALRLPATAVLTLGANLINTSATPASLKTDIVLYYKWVDEPSQPATKKWKARALEGAPAVTQ